MCYKISLFNFHFKVLIIKNMVKFCQISQNFNEQIFRIIVFCVPLLFRHHFYLSQLKHAPSCELLLTACKTVFSHLNKVKYFFPFSYVITFIWSGVRYNTIFFLINRGNPNWEQFKQSEELLDLASVQFEELWRSKRVF